MHSHAIVHTLMRDQPVVAATTIYAIAFEAVRRRSIAVYGHQNLGGTPRWRSVLGILPQAVVMPGLFLMSLRPGDEAWTRQVFINVFASLLLFDFAAMKLNGMMILHHGTCLLGHAYATLTAPEAFTSYFASVVALEAGSSTSCAWWIWGEKRLPKTMTAMYTIGMTASNVLAALALGRWCQHATSLPVVARGAPVLITSVLIFVRQKEMVSVLVTACGMHTPCMCMGACHNVIAYTRRR